MIIFLLIGIILWLSGSLVAFYEALGSIKEMTFFFSLFLSILFNIGAFWVLLDEIKDYLLLTPGGLTLNLNSIKIYIRDEGGNTFLSSFRVPLEVLAISAFLFLVVYISGENAQPALLKAVLYTLPFHVANLVSLVVYVLIHIILLHLRYVKRHDLD